MHYEENFNALLPHLASLKNLAQVVRLRAQAHLAAGHSGEALQDVQFCLCLADTLKSDGLLISSLVRISIAELAFQPIWEGLARRSWDETQITQLQSALARMNILEDYGRVMRTERASAIYAVDLFRTGKYRTFDQSAADPENEGAPDYSKIIHLPGGIFRQNQLTLARRYQEKLIPLVNVKEHRVDVQKTNRAGEVREASRYHPYQLFANLLVPAISHSAERFARAQAALDLALVACALERQRLLTGRYPETLDSLLSKLLEKIPPDVITGHPLKYRLTEDHRFLLYSVGWNEYDEGGTVALTGRSQNFDSKHGDWVWRYPVIPSDDTKP